MAVGRISGPLLKANLLRKDVMPLAEQNLAFETDLLYIDVINGRIGVKTTSPAYDLDVNGTTRSTTLNVTTTADIATFTIVGDTISSTSSTINLVPQGTNPVVYQGTIVVDQMRINTNTIATTGTNTNLEITTSGTGKVNFNSNVEVFGDLHVTGNITADGDINGTITLGDANTDNIVFAGEVNSDIIPDDDITWSLGTSQKRWNTLYTRTINATTVNSAYLYATDFQTSGLDITSNIISSRATNSDIYFNTSGTGGVRLGNLKFLNNTITNVVSGAVTQFVETGTGYVRIEGSNGVVIPSGASNARPQIQYQEIGMIRFNTELQLVEVFNGTAWTSVAGTSSGVNFTDATQIGVELVLTLG